MSKELIERLRDSTYLKFPAMALEAADRIEQLEEQLKEAQAEIERLTEVSPTDEKFISLGEQVVELEIQLAASQAREQQLREALESMCHEFRGHDLPYGSKAYANATTLLNRFLTPDTTALEVMIHKAGEVMRDRMFGDGAKKLERLELELDDCLYVLEALWDKQCNKIVTQQWADILIRNKRATGASSAEDTYHPTTE